MNSTQRIFRVTPGLLVLAACGNTDPKGSVGAGSTTSDGGAFPSSFMSGGQTATRSTSAEGGSHFLPGGSSALGGIGTTASQTGGVNQGGGVTSTLNGTAGTGLAVGSGGVGGSSSSGQIASGGTSTSGGRTATGGVATSGALIRNDTFWKDTSGDIIYSQGGGVLKVGSTYYWYGVKYAGAVTYAANPVNENTAVTFQGVTIYSSTDLANWKFENYALTTASVPDPSNWIGRVGAAYNPTTKKFVLNGQYLGSPDTTQFFATSDTPNGPFNWDHTQAVITNVVNNNCGDQSVFNDDDGKAYLLCSSLSGRANTYIAPLRASDFLEVQAATKIFGGAGREGNAMFKYQNRYYVCSSDLHGWNASHTYCISSTSLMGPYETEKVMGNTDLDFSHVTQTGLFITVKGSAQELVIFGGDRWSDFAGNGLGYNQWLPLTFDGTQPIMQSLSEWNLNASEGTWSVGAGNNFVLNPSFEADRVATNPPAGWTTTNGDDVTDNHTGDFAWRLTSSSSLEHKIASLPNGAYTLSVWVKGSQATGTLYAKGFGAVDKSTPLSGAGTSWSKLSVTGITVSNGTCQVGAQLSSGTVTLDDFTLVRE